MSNAILDHLFRCEEELAATNASKAAELQEDLREKIAAAQTAADANQEATKARDEETEAEATIASLRGGLDRLERDNTRLKTQCELMQTKEELRNQDDLIHEAKRNLANLNHRRSFIASRKFDAQMKVAKLNGTIDEWARVFSEPDPKPSKRKAPPVNTTEAPSASERRRRLMREIARKRNGPRTIN